MAKDSAGGSKHKGTNPQENMRAANSHPVQGLYRTCIYEINMRKAHTKATPGPQRGVLTRDGHRSVVL